jgi:phosphatidylserine/phosphatidylglycerophosphate/cardiolipin synthase-like enzyme
VDSAAVRRGDARIRGYEQALSNENRTAFSFYFSVGMQNMDPRGLLLDGEATLIVSGLQAAGGLADLYYLMARTTWIESEAELDAFIPMPGWLTRLITRVIRNAL